MERHLIAPLMLVALGSFGCPKKVAEPTPRAARPPVAPVAAAGKASSERLFIRVTVPGFAAPGL